MVYDELYSLAEGLKTAHSESNRFRKYYTYTENGEASSVLPENAPLHVAYKAKKSAVKLINPSTTASTLTGVLGGKTSKKTDAEKRKVDDETAALLAQEEDMGMAA